MPKWFIYTIITFIIFIVIVVGSIWIRKKYDIEITTSDIKDCLGIAISCASLLITAFFVVMAVSAYSHVKDIEVKNEVVNKMYKDIKVKSKSVGIDSQKVKKQFQTLSKRIKDTEQLLELEQSRRIVYNYHNITINGNDLNTHILTIAKFGDESDISFLQKICSNPNEAPDISKTAQAAIKEIKDKKFYQQKGRMPNTKREEKLKKTLWLNKILNFFKIG